MLFPRPTIFPAAGRRIARSAPTAPLKLSPQKRVAARADGRRVVSHVPCFSEWQHPRATNPRKSPESGRVRPQRRAAVKKRRRAPGGWPRPWIPSRIPPTPTAAAALVPNRARTRRRHLRAEGHSQRGKAGGASARRGTRPCRRRAAARACPGSRPCPWCASAWPRARRRATRGEPARRARARPGARSARARPLRRPARGGRPAGPGRIRHHLQRSLLGRQWAG